MKSVIREASKQLATRMHIPDCEVCELRKSLIGVVVNDNANFDWNVIEDQVVQANDDRFLESPFWLHYVIMSRHQEHQNDLPLPIVLRIYGNRRASHWLVHAVTAKTIFNQSGHFVL